MVDTTTAGSTATGAVSGRRPRRLRRLAVLGGLAVAIAVVVTLLVNGNTALAASYLVNSTSDAADANVGDGICATSAGECTLRAAVQESNASLVSDQVIVPSGTYTLAIAPSGAGLAENGDLDVLRPLTLTGGGAGDTIVDGAGLDRLLDLHPTAGNVTVTGLTLRNGATSEDGGAVRNGSTGTVRLTSVAVRDSTATELGGAIATGVEAGPGRLEVVDSIIAGNETVGEGGGVHVGGGALRLMRTEVSGNTGRGGGGVYNAGGLSQTGVPSRVELDGATLTGNTALAAGGGVQNDGEGQLVATGSTFVENLAHGDGGGIANGSRGGVTVTGGAFTANSAHGEGGGVFTAGERAVRIDGVTFTENAAGVPVPDGSGTPIPGEGGGGALATGGGTVTVLRATFERNTAVGAGGAILLESVGTVQISDTAVRDNTTEASGGGIENAAGRVSLTALEITGNRAVADGGGIGNSGTGTFSIDRTTIARNTAENGGGLANVADAVLRVTATTLWDNRAIAGGGAGDAGLGGGVYGLGDANATYENTTISGNYAQVRGGGMYIASDAGVRVANSTISANSAPAASGVGGEITSVNFPVVPSQSVLFRNTIVAGNLLSPSCNYAVGSQGGNLEDGNSCYFVGLRDRVGVPDAGLDAIADNGGDILTMLPQQGSFAVDGGVGPCPAVDQRGVARPQNEICDIGAVESEGPFPAADDLPPDTSYISGPVMDTETTSIFTFTGTDPDGATPTAELLYECRLLEFDPTDPPGPVDPTEPVPPEEQFVGCANPWQVPLIEDGTYRFEVRAIDRAHNADPTPAVHEFTLGVDATPPDTQFLDTPLNPSTVNTATFTFTGTDDRTDPRFLEFECRIDSLDPTAWLECTNPATYSNLTPGPHTVQVRAIDLAGNIDPTPASFPWTIGAPTNCDAANITLVATDDATVDEGSVVENFGGAEDLTVRSQAPGADARSLVRFTLPEGGTGCSIQSATLRLTGEGDAGRTLEAVPVTGGWTEGQVTWNTQPPTGGTPVTTASGAAYREWNVTAHVAAMLAGGTNEGWLIRDAAEEDAAGAAQGFVSSEAVREPPTPPQLVLRFDAAGTPPPAAPPAPGAAVTVTCGQVLTVSTRVANDLVCPGEGLVVGAPNIVVDLGGHTIRSSFVVEPGQEVGFGGIRNAGHTNVVIRGGTVENFGHGVRLLPGTTYNVVENMVLRSNTLAGAELLDADNGRNGNTVRASDFRLNGAGVVLTGGTENSTVTGNTFTGNVGMAMELVTADGNTITDNTISGLTGDPLLDSDGGISLEGSSRNHIGGNDLSDTGDAAVLLAGGSHGNRIEGNTFVRASDSAISIGDSDGNEVVDNVAHLMGGEGVSISGATGGLVTGNDVRFNPGGIALSGSSGILVQDNDASGSGAGGITVEASGDSRIIGNTADGTGGDGIAVEAETLDPNGTPIDGNLVEGNTTNGNSGDGVSINGAGHTVTGNAAHHNLAWGITAADGTVDGGGNTASGNAEAPQCVGVICGAGNPPPPGETDVAPPDTQLVSTPPNPSGTLDTAVFTFTGTDNAAPATALRFQCRLDAPADPPGVPADNWTECSSGVSYAFLPSGSHTFEVRALDQADLVDPTPATFTWDVVAAPPGADTEPPSTTLVSAPTDPSSDAVSRFTFRGSDNATPGPNLVYECSLDGAAFGPCVSPLTYPGLAIGPHTFEVRTVDLAGNADPTPALHSWTQTPPPPDTTAPDTTIQSAPDATTVSTDASFEFASDDPDAVFECSLDSTDPAAFTACTSPQAYTGLAVGAHTFAVRAVDVAGNTDGVPATFAWTVTAAPVETQVTCGQVLTTSTRLTNDLVDCPEDGLVIGADGITIDLNGATIDGVGVGAGIRNAGFDAVTITNGFVQEFEAGVALESGTTRNIVSELTVQLATAAGVTLTNADDGVSGNTVRNSMLAGNGSGVLLTAGSQGSLISGNTVAGSSGFGIHVLDSPGNRIEDNNVSGSSDAGIAVEGSTGTVAAGNALDGNSDAALVIELGSHGTIARANTVLESEAGINVGASHDVQLLDNVLNGSSDDGISLETADRALVRGNDVRFNGGGIELAGASDGRVEGNDASEGGMGITLGDGSFRNTVVANTATGNDSEGIAVNGEAPPGDGNLIDSNTAGDNTADGIYIGAVSHMIRGNIADGNGGWGIYSAQGSVGVNIDGGGNRATGNVGGGVFDPVTQTSEQCYNVRCDGGAGLPTDPVAPETILLEAPSNPSAFTTATFAFTGSDNASTVSFQCRLDSVDPAAFAPCSSPVSYPGLALGEHTFTVRAVDFSGNPDASPVIHTWTVQAPEPLVPPVTTIATGPDSNTVSTSATFAFSANEEGVTFECRLDGGAFGPCTSPTGYSGLAVGSHIFEVRGTDPQGNVEVSPASFSWTVGPPPVAAAVSCGQVLTQSTRVTNDLLDCQGNGLVVGANGITLDLDGHVIDGIGLGTGVLVNNFDAVTVTNGAVQEFDTGVGVNAAGGALVSGVSLQMNQVAGIGLTDADGAVVRTNTLAENSLGILLSGGTQDARVTANSLTGNPGPGIRLEGVTGNRVDGNDVAESSSEGVVLDAAPDNVVVGNTLSANSGGGVAVVLGSHNSVVADNTVTLSGSAGIEIAGSNGTDVVANVVSQSSGTGLVLEAANDGLVRGNDLRGNPGALDLNASSGNLIENNDTGSSSGTGIALEGGSIGNDVIGNRSSGNSGAGIYVGDQAAAGTGNLIEGNTANSNSGNGIDVNAAVHTIRGNTVSGNDGWGIYAVTGNIDGGGNQASANVEQAQCWNVVCTIAPPPGAPNTSIEVGPPDPTDSRNALFTFTGTDDLTPVADLSFECRLDSTSDADWAPCENPQQYTALGGGDHVFEVRAIDANEFVDPSPARWEWTYVPLPSGEAPLAVIGLSPAAETPLLEALFTFSANEPDVTFACSLDGAPFTPCTHAVEYEFTELEVGPHDFRVQATDFEGNVGPPARYDWVILGVHTTITAGPAFTPAAGGEPATGGDTIETTATFEFAANAANATFACSIDLGQFVPCTSPRTYAGLAVGEHLLRIVATDPETGREQLEPTEYGWVVITGTDVVPPETVFTAGPPTGAPTELATFEFTGSDNLTAPAALGFECRLDSDIEVDFVPCASPHTFPNADLPEPLTPGPHRLDVRAIDLEDNVDPTPARWEWTFTADTVAPVTVFASGPQATTGASTATFAFSANDPFPAFECALDGAAFEPCTSPHEVQSLEAGPHELAVRATDLSGNVGAPVAFSWTIAAPPVAAFLAVPEPVTATATAVFDFAADQPGSTYLCSLDGAAFGPCTPAVTVTGLNSGEHTFAVQARNAYGVVAVLPIEHRWTVELPPPPVTTFTAQPVALTTDTTAAFTFAADQPGATFECALDTGAFAPCTPPVSLTGLSVGEHTFAVRTTGAAGQVAPSPIQVEWEILPPDTTPPDTTLASGPPATTTDSTATITFASTEPSSTFECSVDNSAYAPCASPLTLTGVTVGTHQVRIRAIDVGTNVDPTPLVVSWTVQPPAPTCPTAPVTAASVADSWVLQDSAAQNYGTDSVLKVDSKSGANSRALVRFGLPALPSGCQVTGAQLRLYSGSYVAGRTLQALPITGAWAEGGVTWAIQPATGTQVATATSGSGYRQWSVTDQVNGMYAGANNGFLIRDASENGGGVVQGFNSREEGSNRPQLVITFGPGTPAPPPTGPTTPPPPADTTAPNTTVDSGPGNPTTATSATVTFSANEPGSTFACSMNGAPFAACTSPLQLTGLTPGSYQLGVRATDAAGNTDATPATYAWTVQATTTTPPPPVNCTAGPATANADRDAWFEQKDPGKNYGTDSVLKVRAKSGENSRALVRFALPATPAGCQIVGAELRLRNGSPVAGQTIQALRVNGAWTENGVTWANQPATTGTAATATTPSAAATMTWNVTAQVQAMAAGTNHGFLLRSATEGGGDAEQGIHAREKAPDAPPQLVITYGPAS